MTAPEGLEILHKLVKQSDILVENFISGKLATMGLGYEDCKKLNPRLIYASITGYGQTGPYRKAAGYDVIVEAEAGLMHITGESDRPPSKVGVAATDIATGLYAHGAIMAALLSRQQTGKGVWIDCNLFETQIAGLANIASNYLIAGKEASRHGTAHPSIVPYQVFPCKDGYLMIGAGNNKQERDLPPLAVDQFKLLAGEILENPALATDPRFATNDARVANREALIQIISDTLLKQDREHWLQRFTGLGVPFGPINNIKQTFDHPQAVAREVIVEVEHPRSGKIKLVAPAVSYNGKKMAVRRPPPWLSEHTTERGRIGPGRAGILVREHRIVEEAINHLIKKKGPVMSLNLDLPTPTDFPAFPYNPPYEIQVELMRHIYTTIEQKKVTIVESPTGTGKTLSLLCASLTWLRDEKDRAKKGKLHAVAGDGADAKDWVIEQTRERVRRELEADEREYEARLAEARKREDLMKKMAKGRVTKKMRKDVPATKQPNDEEDDQFLPESESPRDNEEMYISPALRALMARVESASRSGLGDGEEEPTCTKIYYASRTHSQLTQILPELLRLKLSLRVFSHHPSTNESIPPGKKRPIEDLDTGAEITPCTRTVALGSRKQLCINDELRAKSRDLDEGCRELLGEKGDKRCPHLPLVRDEGKMLDFRDQILATPKDIEDLAAAGRRAQTCPYFGARRAIPQAELITLPYNLLLQKTAREALGIDLTDQIVIIDEAHNLIPTLLSLSTTRLPYATLATSFMQVCLYVSKFRNRLSPANLLHLKRLVVFLDALKKYVLEWKEGRIGKSAIEEKGVSNKTEKVEVMTAAELLERLGRKASGINLLEIEKYLRSSKLNLKVARKIAGYSDKEAEKNGGTQRSRRGEIPPLHAVEAFLVSLTGATEDGRVTFSLTSSPGNGDVELKYQLLNPSPLFKEVVDAARSIILAGGTMSPVSDVVDQLFSYLPPDKFTSFSCGHIIPAENLQAMVVSKGPRGGELEYKAGKQGDSTVIAELGQILLNFINIVPAGMIVFFPSYNFLNTAKAVWHQSGLLDKFGVKKKTTTDKARGALLFAVIGAKLSEGLNFADDLARAVVIIGLPFANLGSPELRERLQYVKRLEQRRPTKKKPGQKDASAELYENMCMNAVNQSIGRAIRHRGDWASLILLDRRYASPSIRNKLPNWIGNGLTVTEGFGQTVKGLGAFYRNRRVAS
ncbi:hypothetical protein D9615_002808 [Tricholomella constricta]|uniref:ATP-dependent DNA helicase CHL1 n=1 Tax=Tricholomella constricta TaxID=117010 RepID=A0A8H5HG33_9AGAR|nr:hypothetical protein D9615_002808 [Tricholomella constricta]